MSRIRILRGLIPNDETVRIHLFDGRNTTGYRILRFDVAPSDWSVDPDCFGVVLTEDLGINARTWDWGSNQQKAWAARNQNAAGSVGSYFARHVDDIIVEDLYITSYTATGQGTNYMLVIEKLTIAEYESALARVQNMSQG